MSAPEEKSTNPPKKKAKFPIWMPPHYRALSKSSEKFAAKYMNKTDTPAIRQKDTLTTHRTFLSAMAILICVDLLLWYGIKKCFYKNPTSMWQFTRGFRQDVPGQGQSAEDVANAAKTRSTYYKKYETVHPHRNFRSRVTSQSTNIPPVVAYHMRVLNLHRITDRLPTRSEVKAAYRTVSLQTHPDTLGQNLSESERKVCEKRFITATRSYEILLTMTSPVT